MDGELLLLHNYMIHNIEFEIVLIQIKKEKRLTLLLLMLLVVSI